MFATLTIAMEKHEISDLRNQSIPKKSGSDEQWRREKTLQPAVNRSESSAVNPRESNSRKKMSPRA